MLKKKFILQIETICRADENDPVSVEECLKTEFSSGRDMREECRVEIADLIQQTKADIHVDPLLQKACAVDVSKYCSDVPQGGGRRKNYILQNHFSAWRSKFCQHDD